jgi:hypothetical protein
VEREERLGADTFISSARGGGRGCERRCRGVMHCVVEAGDDVVELETAGRGSVEEREDGRPPVELGNRVGGRLAGEGEILGGGGTHA